MRILSGEGGRLLLVFRIGAGSYAAHQPASTKVIRINNTAITQFDPLTTPIHPRKVKVESCLHGTKYSCNGLKMMLCSEVADEPVEDVESSIGAKGNQVEGVNYSGHAGLSKKDELWQYANTLKDL